MLPFSSISWLAKYLSIICGILPAGDNSTNFSIKSCTSSDTLPATAPPIEKPRRIIGFLLLSSYASLTIAIPSSISVKKV